MCQNNQLKNKGKKYIRTFPHPDLPCNAKYSYFFKNLIKQQSMHKIFTLPILISQKNSSPQVNLKGV